MDKTDKQRSRNWMGTLNNPAIEAKDFLQGLYDTNKVVYVVG